MVDGCTATGAPDKTDWIIDCPTQTQVYNDLLEIIAELSTMVP